MEKSLFSENEMEMFIKEKEFVFENSLVKIFKCFDGRFFAIQRLEMWLNEFESGDFVQIFPSFLIKEI